MTRARRAYLIDFRTQGPFILKIASVWTGGILLLALLLYFLADEELGRSFYSVHLRIRNTWRILLPAVAVSGGISFLLTIGATVWLSIRESHRLGGPVFKFTRLFRELEGGSFESGFAFRKGDLLVPLGESYRAALAANRDRIAAIRDLSRKAEASLETARTAMGARSLSPEEIALLDDAAVLVASVRSELQSFHLGPN
jgi:hypothetical protein